MAGSRVELEESRVEIEAETERGGDLKRNGDEIVTVNGDLGCHSQTKNPDLTGELEQTVDSGELKGKEESFAVNGVDTDGKIEEREKDEKLVEERSNGDDFEKEKVVKVDVDEEHNASGSNGDLSMSENGELKVENGNDDDKMEEKQEDVILDVKRSNGDAYGQAKVDAEEKRNIKSNGDSLVGEYGELIQENKENAEEEKAKGDRGEEVTVDVGAVSGGVEEIGVEDSLAVEAAEEEEGGRGHEVEVDVVVEKEKEEGMDDKDLGSSEVEEKQDMEALVLTEEEKESLLPRVAEQETEVLVAESESQMEVESQVEKEDTKTPENVVTEIHLEESESASRKDEEHKPVDDESGDVRSIMGEQSLKSVEDADTVAESESDDDAKLRQESCTEEIVNVGELESPVEMEQKQELDTTIQETKSLAELGTVVEEAQTLAKLEPTAKIELKQGSDNVAEEKDKGEGEEKADLNVAIEETDSPSATVVEPERAEHEASEHIPRENVEVMLTSDGDAFANEPSAHLEKGGTDSAAEISGDSLEDELNNKARNVHLESSEGTPMLHNSEKELIEEIIDSTVDRNTELKVSNGETVPSESSSEISLGEKTNSKCIVSSIQGDQPTNKDDNEEPSHEINRAAELVQAPPEAHVVKRQFVYMIKVPRFIDDEFQKEIRQAKSIVDEKTQIRDSIGEGKREQLVVVKQSSLDYNAELAKEKEARAAFNLKRLELEKVQAKINKLNNANAIADIDEKIRHMEHRQQHESISLKQEKQYIQEIKQMRRLREQLCSKQAPKEHIDEALNQRDEIEVQFKKLKKELESLKYDLSLAESNTKSAWNKYMDEERHLNSLKEKHSAADGVRQEAYLQLMKLRNQSSEKDRHFQEYKADRMAADAHKFSGDNQGLISHCSGQVDRFFEQWKNDKEFRDQYVKFNTYSTLRRLETLDGRSLGPGEERPSIRSYVEKSLLKTEPTPVLASEVSRGNLTQPSTTQQVARTNQSAKLRSTKPAFVEGNLHTVSSSGKSKEEEKENKRRKEEEEMARKAEELARKEEELRKEKEAKEEELRKEKAAAELKERLRLEQREKAREAEERKRRKAERALERAAYKLQKEAELKEKKKAKKGRKKAGLALNPGSQAPEAASTPVPDTNPPPTSQEPETSPRPASKRRSSRPASSTRECNRLQAHLPLPLRKRSKRKMTTWMWALLVILLVLVVFFVGNYISLPISGLPNTGY